VELLYIKFYPHACNRPLFCACVSYYKLSFGGGEDIFVFLCVFIFVAVNSAVSSRAVDFLKRPVIYKTLLAHSFGLNFNVCLMFVQ